MARIRQLKQIRQSGRYFEKTQTFCSFAFLVWGSREPFYGSSAKWQMKQGSDWNQIWDFSTAKAKKCNTHALSKNQTDSETFSTEKAHRLAIGGHDFEIDGKNG
jgi:hypothetical protein